ncbi:hypothetical protein [Cohnella lupini]|uniref:Uncharacterized protein n=1 Tax=Cohnella lupini TaxID=1294267 RepID=A0A3D9IIM7_9BACL|nr:hypothetical protein [Cohnella lupini]RED61643.1 hypothetical protein DFP95_10571 [Cohnella lupini]
MDRLGDWIIMLAAAGIMVWWVLRRFDRWLHEPPGSRLRKLAASGGVEQDDDNVQLLQDSGFEVLSGKHKIPLGVTLDDSAVMPTRLYFDYLAFKDDKYYLVKLERLRQQMEWTASGLREKLLVYALLFPDCEGIVIVPAQERKLKIVRFKVEAGE